MSKWITTAGVLACCLATSRPVQAGDVFIDFKTQGTVTTSTLSIGLVDITADDGVLPAQVHMLNLNGIGVVGGAADTTTDGSEALHFTFETLVSDAAYHVGLGNNLDADGKVGETFLEAFVGATSLGVIAVDDIGWKEVSDMFGGVAVTGFTVRADVDGNRIDAMRYRTHWDNLGSGLQGTNGVPRLVGEGWLSAGTTVTTTATQLLENQLATLVVGFAEINAPFKGGVLVPGVALLVPGLPTGGLGELQLSTTWPAGVPSGFQFYLQLWLADPAGVQGYAATNAVRGTTP
ncbi:MAG: hypothetical protein ACYTG2_15045 [Planctomycetota bacterium]